MNYAFSSLLALVSVTISLSTRSVDNLNSSFSLHSNKYSFKTDKDRWVLACPNSSLVCPRWSACGDQVCKCPGISGSVLQCNEFGQISAVKHCFCATYDGNRDVLEVGACIYNCYHSHFGSQDYLSLPANISRWNEFQCGKFNRKGALCGECKEDHYIPAYSYSLTCVRCSNTALNWWKFVAIAFLPLTVFYFILLLFRVNIHVTFLHGYVLYCHSTTIIQVARYLFLVFSNTRLSLRYLGFSLVSFYSVWNLDFFRVFSTDICLHTDLLTTGLLDLAVAVYPVVLTLFLYLIIWVHDKRIKIVVTVLKPLQHFLKIFPHIWNFKSTSLIDVFSTFFFLVSIKCVSVCADYLFYTKLYTIHSNGSVASDYRLFYNATLLYFGPTHLPYAVTAVVILLVMDILPTFILLLYPFRFGQAVMHKLPRTWQIFFHTYIDSVQGCYRNGTEGSRDYRWLSGFIYVVRLLFILAFSLLHEASFRSAVAISLVAFAIWIVIMDPYKPRFKFLHSDFITFILFAAGNFTLVYLTILPLQSHTIYFLIGFFSMIPAAYVLMTIVDRIIKQTENIGKASRR